jgi:hypothetical protein
MAHSHAGPPASLIVSSNGILSGAWGVVMVGKGSGQLLVEQRELSGTTGAKPSDIAHSHRDHNK